MRRSLHARFVVTVALVAGASRLDWQGKTRIAGMGERSDAAFRILRRSQ
jgi:hypothetical protein